MREKTKERLAKLLRERGLHEMALKAAQGVYDDFESNLINPIMTLVEDCRIAGAHDIAAQAMNGDFDGTTEESEAWWKREGKDAFASDILDKRRR